MKIKVITPFIISLLIALIVAPRPAAANVNGSQSITLPNSDIIRESRMTNEGNDPQEQVAAIGHEFVPDSAKVGAVNSAAIASGTETAVTVTASEMIAFTNDITSTEVPTPITETETIIMAQDPDQVLIIPFRQNDPTKPHPAHEGAPITLKATIRNAECGIGYRVWWDVDRDGDYSDETSKDYVRNATTHSVHEIGRSYSVPNVTDDTQLDINVQVQNLCNNQIKTATFPLKVYDFTPSSNPSNWTAGQREIMGQMSVQETLWYLHRTQIGFSGYYTSTIEARAAYDLGTPNMLWLFARNGHLPAYPPGTINDFGQTLPAGWEAENDQRWNNDPYAETTMRLVNYLTAQSQLLTIVAGEEDNSCGYNLDQTVRTCSRLPGTTDNKGIVHLTAALIDGGRVGGNGAETATLAVMLPALAGTPMQTGNAGIPGQSWEWYIQQRVDYLGYAQIDGGCAKGGWRYEAVNGSLSCSGTNSNLDSTSWAMFGLESAETFGAAYGVIVNNRHKFRTADNLNIMQVADGGASRWGGQTTSSFNNTGGAIGVARWLGIDKFSYGDNTVAFPNESTLTRFQLRQIYDQYVAFTNNQWIATERRDSIGWLDGLSQYGDYLCGDTNGVYNQPQMCGNTYAMFWHAMGYRIGTPELIQIGSHDWKKEFNTYYLRAQERPFNSGNPWENYDIFGRIYDKYCSATSYTCANGSPYWSTMLAGLVLTADPGAVADAEAQPELVYDNCYTGGSTEVTFDHSNSYSVMPDQPLTTFQWDVNANDGLWWDFSGTPDFHTNQITNTFVYSYSSPGLYQATLRVVNNQGQSDTAPVNIAVHPPPATPPVASHGGSYTIDQGQTLTLQGSVGDPNSGCGDTLTVVWDLDDDGQFDDATGASTTIPWGTLLNSLPTGQANPIRMLVTDSTNLTDTAVTQLTINPVTVLPALTLNIAVGGNDTLLSWLPQPNYYSGYEMLYSLDPYFLGGDGGVTVVSTPADDNWPHAGAAADMDNNYCYLLRGVTSQGDATPVSNKKCEFTFAITPGN